MSLRELERLTKITKSTLQRIETGQRSPTLDQLEIIAIKLRTKMTELYESEHK